MSEAERLYAAEIEAQRQRSREAAEAELRRQYEAHQASLKPVHDPDSLALAYAYVRAAYGAVKRLRSVDPTIRDVATQLDEIASHIHTEIDDPGKSRSGDRSDVSGGTHAPLASEERREDQGVTEGAQGMRRTILLAGVFALVSTAAGAWATDPQGNLIATNSAEAKILAKFNLNNTTTIANQNVNRNVNRNSAHASASIGAGAGSSTTNVVAGNGLDYPLVSSAVAPSFSVAGPCTGQAGSVGGQFPVFGLSFGGTDLDKACQAEHLGNLQTAGERIALEVLCDSRQVHAAVVRAGYSCAIDRQPQQSPMPPAPSAPLPAAGHVRPAWESQ